MAIPQVHKPNQKTIAKSAPTNQSRRHVFSQAAIYVTSTFIQRAIPFLLLPLLTAYLAPSEYGTVAVFQAVLAIALPFLGTNFSVAIGKEFHGCTRAQMAQLVTTVTTTSIAIAFVLAIGLTAVGLVRGTILGIHWGWFAAAAATAPPLVAGRVHLTLLRFTDQPIRFAVIEIIGVIVNVSISVALIVALAMGWQGRIIGILAGPTVVGIIGIAYMLRDGQLTGAVSRDKVKEVLLLTLPVSLHMISSAFMTGIDRLFIDAMVDKETVGLYSVGFSFAMIVYMLLQSFHQAWGPRMFKTLANPTDGRMARLVRHTYTYDAATVLLALIVTAASYLLIPLMTADAYHASTQYVVWLAVAFAINGMYSMRTYYLIHTGKTGFLGTLAFAVVLINVVSNYFLIRANGAVGAAQATLIAYAVRFVSVWWYSHRVHPMPWRRGLVPTAST